MVPGPEGLCLRNHHRRLRQRGPFVLARGPGAHGEVPEDAAAARLGRGRDARRGGTGFHAALEAVAAAGRRCSTRRRRRVGPGARRRRPPGVSLREVTGDGRGGFGAPRGDGRGGLVVGTGSTGAAPALARVGAGHCRHGGLSVCDSHAELGRGRAPVACGASPRARRVPGHDPAARETSPTPAANEPDGSQATDPATARDPAARASPSTPRAHAAVLASGTYFASSRRAASRSSAAKRR